MPPPTAQDLHLQTFPLSSSLVQASPVDELELELDLEANPLPKARDFELETSNMKVPSQTTGPSQRLFRFHYCFLVGFGSLSLAFSSICLTPIFLGFGLSDTVKNKYKREECLLNSLD
ncbi:hypothetical protein H5410_057909 [Solanum commersonii]|uniref:Uncharacterized protein n=1 Tax=Solanum commersonii TaxID=4109 RepID=A0A9J5WRC5_SOLCO|nr:hypothetical protein H5410_057909 [Solanum commersonii]